jgi:hypothetical protein
MTSVRASSSSAAEVPRRQSQPKSSRLRHPGELGSQGRLGAVLSAPVIRPAPFAAARQDHHGGQGGPRLPAGWLR